MIQAILFATLAVLALPAAAQGLNCEATEQCRGGATTMCAPSNLTIAATRRGGARAHLWIDGQGPYAGRVTESGVALEGFAGRYRLNLRDDGAFTYTGNRGKTFTGRCEGSL